MCFYLSNVHALLPIKPWSTASRVFTQVATDACPTLCRCWSRASAFSNVGRAGPTWILHSPCADKLMLHGRCCYYVDSTWGGRCIGWDKISQYGHMNVLATVVMLFDFNIGLSTLIFGYPGIVPMSFGQYCPDTHTPTICAFQYCPDTHTPTIWTFQDFSSIV